MLSLRRPGIVLRALLRRRESAHARAERGRRLRRWREREGVVVHARVLVHDGADAPEAGLHAFAVECLQIPLPLEGAALLHGLAQGGHEAGGLRLAGDQLRDEAVAQPALGLRADHGGHARVVQQDARPEAMHQGGLDDHDALARLVEGGPQE
jgi:hypothetical protein